MKKSPLATLSNNTQRLNAEHALAAKVRLRQLAKEWVKCCRVLDLFYGAGEMRRRAWFDVDHYVGCDIEPNTRDGEQRLVCDNRLVLRTFDLSAFNVFDLDAFGSPWEQLEIISNRRKWEHGERGAIVVTDGTSMNLRLGSIPVALAGIIGKTKRKASGNGLETQQEGLLRWCERSRVTPSAIHRAKGDTSAVMRYSSVLFTGD